MSEKDWEVEFDEKFKRGGTTDKDVKDFIRTLLSRRILLPDKKETEYFLDNYFENHDFLDHSFNTGELVNDLYKYFGDKK